MAETPLSLPGVRERVSECARASDRRMMELFLRTILGRQTRTQDPTEGANVYTNVYICVRGTCARHTGESTGNAAAIWSSLNGDKLAASSHLALFATLLEARCEFLVRHIGDVNVNLQAYGTVPYMPYGHMAMRRRSHHRYPSVPRVMSRSRGYIRYNDTYNDTTIHTIEISSRIERIRWMPS